MNRILKIIFLLFLLAGCSKKKEAAKESQAGDSKEAPVSLDLPIIRGRNLDSLKSQKYENRLLAFSIELGYRSRDFNQRLSVMVAVTSGQEDWKKTVGKNIISENYKSAEAYNRRYLDSLKKMIASPPEEFRPSFRELTASYERLKNNYAILNDHEKFKTMAAILDTVLGNELAINRTLKNFETKMEINKKLPN
jgi:hypothetical protein